MKKTTNNTDRGIKDVREQTEVKDFECHIVKRSAWTGEALRRTHYEKIYTFEDIDLDFLRL